MKQKVRRFVANLSAEKSFPDVCNFYAANPLAKKNITLYLLDMAVHQPAALLVGEAPGFQGCRQTGIPFTSEWILGKGAFLHPFLPSSTGYAVKGQQKEPTATIVWEEIRKRKALPLLWNSFPLHPHQKGRPHTNRKPRAAELKWGREVLMELIRLFPTIQSVIAVGNQAHEQLLKCKLSYPIAKVRHPAHGGKPAFVEGLQRCIL